jgi:hypothetical protein
MTDTPRGHLYLGGATDPSTGDRTDTPMHYDASNLTTHGVIVGMTGSGKTGLGVVVLEEALTQGIPTLVIDPKGDMGNLLLGFENLSGPEFEPWIDAVAAQRDGVSIAERAVETAEMWRNGLAGWGLDGTDIAALHDRADFAIYTPGSNAGIPLNVIGSLRAPATDDTETIADEIEGFASSILGLVGIDADPLASREHILISNIISHAWANGIDIDLAGLIGAIQQPPMRKLGVIDLETFYPAADRMKLALTLNGLMASPSFAAWIDGVELDIASLLFTADGRPRCAVVTLSHLTDAERQFVVTLLLSKVVTWMRSQPGTTDLRALIYMDEVFGFVPPSAMPPAKKPILTIFKQARAFGVGMILSTQNPVDLDYKAISNAGTWMIGRLQTERDKGRLLEGMTSSSGAVDISAIDDTISGLGKRQFLLFSTKSPTPKVFATRWAMSYLPGPLTREQISVLMDPRRAEFLAAAAPAVGTGGGQVIAGAPSGAPALADDETTTPPPVAEGTRVAHLDPAAPWAAEVGAVAGGTRLQAALVARVNLLFDETVGDLRHHQEWEAVLFPLDSERADMDAAIAVDYDDRDLTGSVPENARYVLPVAKIRNKTYFSRAATDLRDRLFRTETLPLFRNTELKAISRPDESAEDFRERCRRLADDQFDAAADKLRDKYETRIDREQAAIAKAEDRLREAEADASRRGTDEIVSGVGDVLGSLFGGRKSARSIVTGLRRAGSKRSMRDKAHERVETARNRLTEEYEDLDELQEDLADELEELADHWEDVAGAITPLEVRLKKTNIAIDEITLVWIPTA